MNLFGNNKNKWIKSRWTLVFVKSGLKSKQASSKIDPFTLKMPYGTETSGLNSEGGLNFEWS